MNKAFAIVSAIGADRVGIVDDVSGFVAGLRCNIEESKMAVLGGEFAVIMLVSGSADALDDLEQQLQKSREKIGLSVFFRKTSPPAALHKGIPCILKTVSQDTPGIVHSVTSMLKKYDINIEDLETETTPAPLTGTPLFHMRARVVLPPSVSVSKVRRDLAALEMEQDLDIELKPIVTSIAE